MIFHRLIAIVHFNSICEHLVRFEQFSNLVALSSIPQLLGVKAHAACEQWHKGACVKSDSQFRKKESVSGQKYESDFIRAFVPKGTQLQPTSI